MRALRAANAWFDRMPWYVDGAVCLVPLVIMAVVSWLLGDGLGVFTLVSLTVAVLAGRFLNHRRTPRRHDHADSTRTAAPRP